MCVPFVSACPIRDTAAVMSRSLPLLKFACGPTEVRRRRARLARGLGRRGARAEPQIEAAGVRRGELTALAIDRDALEAGGRRARDPRPAPRAPRPPPPRPPPPHPRAAAVP